MTEADLLQLIARGEDSRHQFKRDETNADSIAAELAAFANSGGGTLFLGVEDSDRVTGLDATNVRRLNQLLSNAASQNVRPPIHPTTENIQTAQGIVIAVTVPDGLSKPYVDNLGSYLGQERLGQTPRHRPRGKQRYRLTAIGRQWLEVHLNGCST